MQLDYKQNDAEDELFRLYFGSHPADCTCNLGLTPTFSLALAGRQAITAAALNQIRSGSSDPVNEHLFGLWFDNYNKAIDQVFGRSGAAFQSAGMEAGFRVNVAQMAAYKAYRVTSELTSLRREVVSQKELEQKAAVVLQKYTRYQGAEYQTIVARSRTAQQFLRFQAEANRFPNLTWLRTRSANPRERHLNYVGITLPIGHPFWNENQPGNLYNCKCDWKTTSDPVTKAPDEIIKPSPGLEGNPAITGELITDKHPYFKGPAWVGRNALLMLPEELAYKATEVENVLLHLAAEKEPETAVNKLVSNILIKENLFKEIKLMPRIYKDETNLRKRVYGDAYAVKHSTKCPDAWADGELIEFKKTSLRNMANAVTDAVIQSDIVVLHVKEEINEKYLNRFAAGRLKNTPSLKKLIIINKQRAYSFHK
ncbi:MAG: hypothetical protein PHU33_15965 [Bacteroidales bacterium]|nr:hypothetical protein [Bacteroidales bacterium]